MRGGFPSTVWSMAATALAAWLSVRWLGAWHWSAPLTVGMLAVAFLAAAVRVRTRQSSDRARLGKWLTWVARRTGDAAPVAPTAQPLLTTPADFVDATARLRRVVYGHDLAAVKVMRQLEEGVSLARRRPSSDRRPLASLVLAGPAGVGKKRLASVAGRLLYGEGSVLEIDCHHATPIQLVGTADAPGPLTAALRLSPGHTLVFDASEGGTPELWRWLRGVIASGSWDDASAVSLRHAVLVLVASSDSLAANGFEGREAVNEQVADATGLPPDLVTAASEVVVLGELSDGDRGRLTAKLLQSEARRHGVDLTRVEPEVLAGLLGDARSGFSRVATRVEQLLRAPLARCVAGRHTQLALEIDWDMLPEARGK